MSIAKTIKAAYLKAEKRKFQKIYYAIDIHDTVLSSNYENGEYEFINGNAKDCLQILCTRPEVVIIFWSSMAPLEQRRLCNWLDKFGIHPDFFNENPLEKNTPYADFSRKFYFSVLLDDKAGFDPSTDWDEIINFYETDNWSLT